MRLESIVLIGLLVILSGVASALPEFNSIQERAQAQSLSGATLLNDSLYSNPAASAFTSVYTVDAIYALPKTFGVSVLDTKTSGFGGGVGYFRKAGENNTSLQGARAALSTRVSEVLALGVAGKTIWGPGRHLNDVDAGTLVNFGVAQVGFTMRNIFSGSRELDQPREWSVGGRFGYQESVFVSAASYSRWTQVKPYQVGVGMEFVTPYYFSFKGGYRFEPGGKFSAWSGGLSFNAPKISLHYAIDLPRFAVTEHLLGVTLML